MPDISMCSNSKCELKENCYRFIAKPNPYRQAYAEFSGGKDCMYFWKVDKKQKEKNDVLHF